MIWSFVKDNTTLIAACIAAGAALFNVLFSPRFARDNEHVKWLREQRLQAYVDFLQSVAQVFDRHDAFVRSYKFETQYPQVAV